LPAATQLRRSRFRLIVADDNQRRGLPSRPGGDWVSCDVDFCTGHGSQPQQVVQQSFVCGEDETARRRRRYGLVHGTPPRSGGINRGRCEP
jgi:hypothetical protein